jgi:hypothetical protein
VTLKLNNKKEIIEKQEDKIKDLVINLEVKAHEEEKFKRIINRLQSKEV